MSWYVCGTFFYIDPAVLYTFQQEVWIHFPEQTEHHQLQSLDKHSPDMQFPSCWSGIMNSSNYTWKTGYVTILINILEQNLSIIPFLK